MVAHVFTNASGIIPAFGKKFTLGIINAIVDRLSFSVTQEKKGFQWTIQLYVLFALYDSDAYAAKQLTQHNGKTALTQIQNMESIGKRKIDTSRYINRELSWLAFNTRVLEEARNPHHPLLERVKFLSISASNLNEFYMVRIAGLRDQLRNNLNQTSIDGMTPKQQLVKIQEAAKYLAEEQQQCWLDLRDELEKEHIFLVSSKDLSSKDTDWLEQYFLDNIFAALSPIAIDPAHPLPFLPNLGLTVVVQFNTKGSTRHHKSLVILPHKLDRFIHLPKYKNDKRCILLEDVIIRFLHYLFPEKRITGSGMMHITRDSDLEVDDDAEDLVRHYESAVKRRRRGSVIRLKFSKDTPKALRQFFRQQLGVENKDVQEVPHLVGLEDGVQLYEQINQEHLKFKPYNKRFPERINDFNGNCFEAIAAKDIVIHHPYETFDVVVKFLQQAARDPDVITIKQTLYRTSNDSPIVSALIEAAEAGKAVTVVVELKARFDEEANIRWAKNLERVGAQVVYGFPTLKTHCKISLVVRREGKHNRSYVHFGTGNYHPITARVYSDLSFFTCDDGLCKDAVYLFNYLTGYAPPDLCKKVFHSPKTLRSNVIALVDAEIAHAKAGRPANIWAKMNSLIDKEMIDKLYEASNAGVSIDLIVRGICGLRPGVKGYSENIRVKSIVGRFLEHARIFCFGNGHTLPSEHAKVFISSADWMPRNFDRRVEVMVPISTPTVHEQIMGQIMLANLQDVRQSWQLQSDGTYRRISKSPDGFSAHEYFVTNPSLSGRGTSLSKSESHRQKQKIYQLFAERQSKKDRPDE